MFYTHSKIVTRKNVLLISAVNSSFTTDDYGGLIGVIQRRAYDVTPVPIKWKNTVPADWVRQLQQEYGKYDPANTVLAGYSFGAMIAFMAAAERNPSALWLFSLSSYFAEDLPSLSTRQLEFIGPAWHAGFANIQFAALSRRVTCPTILFIGTEESEGIHHRATDAHRQLANARIVEVPGVGHNAMHTSYLAAIERTI